MRSSIWSRHQEDSLSLLGLCCIILAVYGVKQQGEQHMSKIEIVNITPGRLVINSLKITLPPEKSLVVDESVLSDPDVMELMSFKKIVVKKQAEQQTDQQTDQQNTGRQKNKKGKKSQNGKSNQGRKKTQTGKSNQGGKKTQTGQKPPRPGKTTPKKQDTNTASQSTAENRQLADLNTVGNQMGRAAVVMDGGEPVRKNMNPGIHSTGEPIRPDEPGTSESKPEERDSAFIDM